MVKRKSTTVASDSRLFVLALGLLVGFVIAFVLLLSRLPVDNVISQYNKDVTHGAEVEKMNFDYYAVLEAQKAARKPAPQPVVIVEPPVVLMEPPKQMLPQTPIPAAPTIAPVPVPLPRAEPPVVQPRIEPPAIAPRVQQPRLQAAPVQPRIQTPQPRIQQPQVRPQMPRIETAPDVQPLPEAPVRDAAVREIMASQSGQDSYYVEAGSYQDNNDAISVQSALRSMGLESFIVVRPGENGNFDHRVRIGPFLEQSRLDATRNKLRNTGINPKLIRVKG